MVHDDRGDGAARRERITVGALIPDDTSDYVRSRLARVGATKDVFSADALAMLHEAAGSSLRDTDRIATAALRTAARRKKKLVERDLLSRILQAEAEERSWPSDGVVVIDTDLGQSGAFTDREGFQKLVAEVGMGRAGSRSLPSRARSRRCCR